MSLDLEHTGHLNGYKPRSFGDVLLAATFIISGLVWGIKLEINQDAMERDIQRVEVEVAKGVLPRADERLRAIEARLIELGDDFDEHDDEHNRSNND